MSKPNDKKEKKNLGRGLRSLIPDSEIEIHEKGIEIEIALIDPNPMQPRKVFKRESLEELSKSIKDIGLINPITVQKIGERYQLISGERRLYASKLAGLTKIAAIIRDVNSEELLRIALIENIQREELNEIELAQAYKRLKDEFFLTQNEIAEKVGKSRSVIANTLRLLELSQNIQEAVRNGEISAGHARALIALNDDKRERVLEIIRKKSLSVRQVEALVKEQTAKGDGEKTEPITNGADHESVETQTSLDPDTSRVLDMICERFRTKVEVKQTSKNGKGGKIIIHYYDTDDFNYIFTVLADLEQKRNIATESSET